MNTDAAEIHDRDDDALLDAIRRGDADAFGPLVEKHLGRIHAFIALKLPVPHLVDEIAHETFVFAYRNLGKFTPGTSFRAWLRAIAANKVRAEIERYCRERANRIGYAEHRLIELAGLQPDAAAASEAEAMRHCLDQIPRHMRDLLALKYRDECPAAEIATRLSRSIAWVRTTLFRIRRELRTCIEARMAEERP